MDLLEKGLLCTGKKFVGEVVDPIFLQFVIPWVPKALVVLEVISMVKFFLLGQLWQF